MVTGTGLAATLKQKFPRWILVIVAFALFANSINVGSDLAGISDAVCMLTGVNSHWFVVLFGIMIAYSTVRFRYFQIAKILKWLALFLFAYVVTALAALRDTFINAWQNLVAILGTTISPYLFFWQTSEEVEEKKADGSPNTAATRRRNGTGDRELRTQCWSRYIFFQHRDVFYRFHLRADATRARHARDRKLEASRGSA
jgi:Mn2+/Fe2+ NRAMP family transporter